MTEAGYVLGKGATLVWMPKLAVCLGVGPKETSQPFKHVHKSALPEAFAILQPCFLSCPNSLHWLKMGSPRIWESPPEI